MMTGTDKQVTWANEIQSRMMTEVATLSALLAEGKWEGAYGKVGMIPAAELPLITGAFNATRKIIENGKDAGWFIDRAKNSVAYITIESLDED